MATNWTTQNKASTTDNWCAWGIGSAEREICGISIEGMYDKWESMSSNYWETMGLLEPTWTFSGTAVARDSD